MPIFANILPISVRALEATIYSIITIRDGVLSHSLVVEKCYRFSNGGWKEFARMKEKRFHSDGVIYDNKFHVFGGKNLVTSLKTSEIISLDGGVSKGPDLPTAVTG